VGQRSPAGSRGGAPVGVWGEAPRSWTHYAKFTTHNKQKLQYKDINSTTKYDNLAQEIKLVWSSQSELVSDFGRFDWRRLRIHVRGSAQMMPAAHVLFSRLRVEKERSGVAVVTQDGLVWIHGCIACCVCIQCSLGWFRCSIPALRPQLKLGSELAVTVVDERLIHFHRR